MGMGFAPTWLRQVSPLLHRTTLTTGLTSSLENFSSNDILHIPASKSETITITSKTFLFKFSNQQYYF